MIVDTSALIAILRDESDAKVFAMAIAMRTTAACLRQITSKLPL